MKNKTHTSIGVGRECVVQMDKHHKHEKLTRNPALELEWQGMGSILRDRI